MNELVLKNPITNAIKNSVNKSINKVNFAAPFLSSFAKSIFTEPNIIKIPEKKLITRFDESCISSFELPTLKSLLDIGFKIRYDNNMHLKLYITDTETYITSSNLTKGGFEDNVELTVKVDSDNTLNCMNIFNEIWENCKENNVTIELINANMGKYVFLKKREKYEKENTNHIISNSNTDSMQDIEQIIDEIFNQKIDYSEKLSLKLKANKIREQTKEKLKRGFDSEIFCVPKGHPLRKTNLAYDFAHGYEDKLAGAGLRDSQYEAVFGHPEFEKVINYIYPEMIGMKPWNFQDKTILLEFCNGIFDFKIQQYTGVIPIRLVSYFYPDIFLPIFKLEHLKKICEVLGLDTNAKSKGDKLYAYNSLIAEKTKTLPYDNYIKMHISYQIFYTVELYNRLKNKEEYIKIKNDYNEIWIKNKIEEGKQILIKLKKIESEH